MSYWPLFRDYISDLYQGMPLWVYVAALCIVVAGSVTLIAVKGWKKGTTAIARLFLLVYVGLLLCATWFSGPRKPLRISGPNPSSIRYFSDNHPGISAITTHLS